MSSHQHGSGTSLPNRSQSATPTTGGYPPFFNQYGSAYQQEPFHIPPYEPATLPQAARATQFQRQATVSAPPNPPLNFGGYGEHRHLPPPIPVPRQTALPQEATTSVAGRKRKREPDDVEKLEIINFYGKSIKDAARRLKVTMKEFVKRANEVGIYEWTGVNGKQEKITHLISNMKEEILVRLLLEEKNEFDEDDTMIPIFVPATFTFDQFKIMATEKYQSINVPFQLAIDSGLSWKVDDKWAQLTNSQAWHFLVKTWFSNNKREFIDIRLSPNNKLDTQMKESLDFAEYDFGRFEKTGATPGGAHVKVGTLAWTQTVCPQPELVSSAAMDKGKAVME
ncbi:hypothetical protein Tco_0609599 [Tanacetum coccineum]